ncbi:MAG: BlaI/MecI/CopY family transcriptional regulator [Gemmatimonadetes bacterium]|jgi:BlaI family transcriptional regulator, penicillinase repressor|nr:BlaI/MecI/CopY family transcriptional regulator [Gemmatimonadota bacterium]
MSDHDYLELGRRERQIMDIIFRRGEATASQVQEDLPSPLTNATVRTWLRYLENKGYLKHRKEGPRFVYSPTWPRQQTQTSALRQVLRTFFGGSPSKAIAALIDLEGDKLIPEEIARLDALLAEAREKGG